MNFLSNEEINAILGSDQEDMLPKLIEILDAKLAPLTDNALYDGMRRYAQTLFSLFSTRFKSI